MEHALRHSLYGAFTAVALGCGAADAPPPPQLPTPDAPAPTVEEVAVTAAKAPTLTRSAAPVAGLAAFDPAWKAAPWFDVTVVPQREKGPMLDKATISMVRVQALTDGKDIAWRLSWDDPTPDGNVDAGRFSDAVAISLPLDAGAAPQMGHPGGRVQILYWKALWQKDKDEHFQDVSDLHPNEWNDLYWFVQGGRPYRVPDSFTDPRSHAWFVAKSAGNPMSVFSRTEPAEELSAEGPGSLTHQPEAVTQARGAWREGRWAVVLSRPLKTADPSDAQLGDGPLSMTLAVWDGSGGNVGGRKHWAAHWLSLEVAP